MVTAQPFPVIRWFPTLLHIFALGTLACAPGKDQKTADATPRGFRAALLTHGPISDKSWNAGAYAGLLRIRDSLGASVSHMQTRTPAEFEANFRQYGAHGYAMVIGNVLPYH